MTDTNPLRTAADVVDANKTAAGITETFLDALKKRVPIAFGPTETISTFNFSTGSPPLALVNSATGYLYFYNADDTTTADDGLTCLVSADGRRYILADASAIAISSVLAITNTPPVSPVDGDAYVVDTSPTGVWVGHAKDIALRTPRGWVFAQPAIGTALLNQQTGLNIQYSAAGTWGAMATAIDAADVSPEALLFPMGLSVEAQQNAPPGSPAVGPYYLVGLSPTGAWSGQSNKIAYYTSASVWAFLATYDGAQIYNKASDTTLTWFDATGDWRAQWPIQSICYGRLTTETGVPISTADRTAQATIYFTPFKGNTIALYVNGGWALRTFTEKSLSIAGFTTGKCYDIFGYDNSGVLAIESLVWTSDLVRATALALQDGVLVKSGDSTRRYLGTFYTTATGQTEDSLLKRMVWSHYSRARRPMDRVESTGSWAYTGTAYQVANNAVANALEFVVGVSEDIVEAEVNASCSAVSSTSGVRSVAIGLNSVTTPAAGGSQTPVVNTAGTGPMHASWKGYVTAGRNKLNWIENSGSGSTAITWTGSSGFSTNTGISGNLWG